MMDLIEFNDMEQLTIDFHYTGGEETKKRIEKVINYLDIAGVKLAVVVENRDG